MKNLFVLGSIAILLACNNNPKPGEVSVTSNDGKTTASIDANKLVQASDDLQKKTEELQKLPPYTLEQMKAFLPEELAGAKRAKFSANSAMGTAYAEADYTFNDSTEISLKLFDCAGQAGAGVYSMQYLGMMNFQSESDDEYTKTIDFNGGKAIEQGKKDGSRSTLTFLAADRLLVTLEGENTSADQLKKAEGNLNFK